MELKVKTCYTQVLAFQLYSGANIENAISSMTISTPSFKHESMNSYIETEVVFVIKNIKLFADLWDAAYRFPSERHEFYKNVLTGEFCTK